MAWEITSEAKTVIETSQAEAEVVAVVPIDFNINEESDIMKWSGPGSDYFPLRLLQALSIPG